MIVDLIVFLDAESRNKASKHLVPKMIFGLIVCEQMCSNKKAKWV